MDRIPDPGEAPWAMTAPPEALMGCILSAVEQEAGTPATRPGEVAALPAAAALALCGVVAVVATGLWAPGLAAAQQVAGWLAATAAIAAPLAVWPAVAVGALLVGVELAILDR
jgi:hypothetical protein